LGLKVPFVIGILTVNAVSQFLEGNYNTPSTTSPYYFSVSER